MSCRQEHGAHDAVVTPAMAAELVRSVARSGID
jgi:hypothetical protein